MAKAEIVTCRNCKKKIDKTTAYSEKKGQYFCDADCFNEYNAPKEVCYVCKKLDKTSHMTYYLGHWFCKDCLSTWLNSEEGQRDSFLDYVWNLYDPSVRTTPRYMTIRKQAEYYHKEYGLKYKGMLLAVKYHVETLERMWHNEYGLGQVLPKTFCLPLFLTYILYHTTVQKSICNIVQIFSTHTARTGHFDERPGACAPCTKRGVLSLFSLCKSPTSTIDFSAHLFVFLDTLGKDFCLNLYIFHSLMLFLKGGVVGEKAVNSFGRG